MNNYKNKVSFMKAFMEKQSFKSAGFIIGIDEVGRGAIAGPVAVAALALPLKSLLPKAISRQGLIKSDPAGICQRQKQKSKLQFKNQNLILRDSKKLSVNQREIWFHFIKKQKIPFAIASVSPKIIDKINISQAANLAAAKALKRLIKNYKLRIQNCRIYLDGGLYLQKKFLNFLLPSATSHKGLFYVLNSRTIIKGDEKIPAISLASIVAKVSRDRLMKKLHKKYPRYDFINNVGYGTKKHIKAIKKFGPSPIHRKSFKPIRSQALF